MLRVGYTNGIGGYRLVIVCGLLGRLRCRCALPRYDLTELARAVALAHVLRCCSSMSGLSFVIGLLSVCLLLFVKPNAFMTTHG